MATTHIRNNMHSPLVLNSLPADFTPTAKRTMPAPSKAFRTVIAPGATVAIDSDEFRRIVAGDIAFDAHVDRGRVSIVESAADPTIPTSDENSDVTLPEELQDPGDTKRGDKLVHDQSVVGAIEAEVAVPLPPSDDSGPKRAQPRKAGRRSVADAGGDTTSD